MRPLLHKPIAALGKKSWRKLRWVENEGCVPYDAFCFARCFCAELRSRALKIERIFGIKNFDAETVVGTCHHNDAPVCNMEQG